MKISVGTDVIEISRIKKNYEQFGQTFLDKIFTKEEQKYCFSKKNIFSAFSSRFAAKEAFGKACHCGINKNLSWLDISVINAQDGHPELMLSNKAEELLKSLHFTSTTVSLSDTNQIANAVVVLS